MRSGEQIQKFGASVDQKLEQVRATLPPDLIIARTSDQPLQVKENIDLFMEALYEAILLVVLIALVGFWEWRSALLMAISMPITLAMTFGMAHLVNIDLQQVSIATLIIALGLLVDDPVVANDAIKRELAAGIRPLNAAWLGPTKLARAILYATATNIIAYLPFLMLTGSTGDFLYSLPVVMTSALVSSRLASMTFIPLLGYYLLRPSKKQSPPSPSADQRGFYGFYYSLAGKARFASAGACWRSRSSSSSEGAWSPRISKASSFPKTFNTGPTSTSGSPTMRPCLLPNRPRSASNRSSAASPDSQTAHEAPRPTHSPLRHQFRRRRWLPLLVLRLARTATAKLRAGPHPTQRKRGYSRLSRPVTACTI